MGILDRLLNRKKKEHTNAAKSPAQIEVSGEVVRLRELNALISKVTVGDHYVAKSEYSDVITQYKPLIQWFQVLKDSGTLEDFCRKNTVSEEKVTDIMLRFNNLSSIIDSQNDQFIQRMMMAEKDYLDNILKECDPAIILDDDQRKVVLTDEDYCLVVAGAGAGKTTTVAAKVKYLVDKQGIDPKEILVISFTNKAVNELKQRIIGDLHIECPIATFHSTGNAILRKQNPEKLNIADHSKLYFVLQDYFRETILKNESTVNNLILFFASYFDAPFEGRNINDFFNYLAKSNYSTMRSELDDFKREVIDIRTRKAVTIQSEVMRSAQEVEIANFLYLNGIDYEYEPLYRYDIQYSRKPYTPDFLIRQDGKEAYLEHFGITQDGRNNRYSSDELKAYKNAINDKIKLHKEHGTVLLYTFSAYNDHRSLTDHLSEQIVKAGFELRPRPKEEIMQKLITSEENRYIRRLVTLVQRFITNFKTNGYTAEDFNRMYHSTQNVRTGEVHELQTGDNR